MAPTCSTEPDGSLNAAEQASLLEVVHTAIRHGVSTRTRHRPELEHLPPRLQHLAACFVTLHLHGVLRGCVGTLKARDPLALAAARAAYNAAFEDPRFSPLVERELQGLSAHVSVLSSAEPMSFVDEADLLSQLRPGIDGLILREGESSGTFLPSVWEQLPERAAFLQQLKRKAGLSANYWSNTLEVERYAAHGFGDDASHAIKGSG